MSNSGATDIHETGDDFRTDLLNGLLVQGTSDNADLDGAFYSEGYFDGCTRMIEVGFFQRIEFLPV